MGILGLDLDPQIREEIRHLKNQYFDRLLPSLARPIPGAVEWVNRLNGPNPQAVAASAPITKLPKC